LCPSPPPAKELVRRAGFPSPLGGEGKGEGKFQIFLARIYLGFGIWVLELRMIDNVVEE